MASPPLLTSRSPLRGQLPGSSNPTDVHRHSISPTPVYLQLRGPAPKSQAGQVLVVDQIEPSIFGTGKPDGVR